jgi:hypothetical protein
VVIDAVTVSGGSLAQPSGDVIPSPVVAAEGTHDRCISGMGPKRLVGTGVTPGERPQGLRQVISELEPALIHKITVPDSGRASNIPWGTVACMTFAGESGLPAVVMPAEEALPSPRTRRRSPGPAARRRPILPCCLAASPVLHLAVARHLGKPAGRRHHRPQFSAGPDLLDNRGQLGSWRPSRGAAGKTRDPEALSASQLDSDYPASAIASFVSRLQGERTDFADFHRTGVEIAADSHLPVTDL